MRTTRLDISLKGFEVGVSGAVPNRQEWTEPAMDRGVLEFVALFTGLVVKYGGRIIHGAHPTFTPVILRQAAQHFDNASAKPVTLVMSQLWAQEYSSGELEALAKHAELVVTPQVGEGGPDNSLTRNRSLTRMREFLIQRMNVMVAVGGKLHAKDGIIPGVREEVDLARLRGMACFLVGGLGGMASEYAEGLDSTAVLRNGLTVEQNEHLFNTTDVADSVNIVFEQLASGQELIKRHFRNLTDANLAEDLLAFDEADEIEDDNDEPPPMLLR